MKTSARLPDFFLAFAHRAVSIGFLLLLAAWGLKLFPGTTDMGNQRFIALNRKTPNDKTKLIDLAHVPAENENPTLPFAMAGDGFRLTGRKDMRDLAPRMFVVTADATIGELRQFLAEATGQTATLSPYETGWRLVLANAPFAENGLSFALVHPHSTRWPLAGAFAALDLALAGGILALTLKKQREAIGVVLLAAGLLLPTIAMMALQM